MAKNTKHKQSNMAATYTRLNRMRSEAAERVATSGKDKRGFYSDGIHCNTGTLYNHAGYDQLGYDINGWLLDPALIRSAKERCREASKSMMTDSELGKFALTQGYTLVYYSPVHKATGTIFGPDGFNQKGFDIDGTHRDTGTTLNHQGFNIEGVNMDTALDVFGFDVQKMQHIITGTLKDETGKHAMDLRYGKTQWPTKEYVAMDGYIAIDTSGNHELSNYVRVSQFESECQVLSSRMQSKNGSWSASEFEEHIDEIGVLADKVSTMTALLIESGMDSSHPTLMKLIMLKNWIGVQMAMSAVLAYL